MLNLKDRTVVQDRSMEAGGYLQSVPRKGQHNPFTDWQSAAVVLQAVTADFRFFRSEGIESFSHPDFVTKSPIR